MPALSEVMVSGTRQMTCIASPANLMMSPPEARTTSMSCSKNELMYSLSSSAPTTAPCSLESASLSLVKPLTSTKTTAPQKESRSGGESLVSGSLRRGPDMR